METLRLLLKAKENEEIAPPSLKEKKPKKKYNPINVNADEKDEYAIPTSGPGFWVYVVFMMIIMGIVRALLGD